MMSGFEELDIFLSEDFSSAYWGEEGSDRGMEVAERLTTQELEMLRAVWKERPQEWRLRCADVLAAVKSPVSLQTLLEMLQESDDDLVLVAAESLRSFAGAGMNIQVSSKVARRIQELAEKKPGVIRMAMDALLSQLQVTPSV